MVSIIVTWRNRHELAEALPNLYEAALQVGGDVTIVNYSGSSLLLKSQIDLHKSQVIEVSGQKYFNKAAAQNIGAAHTHQPLLFFCDCDVIVKPLEIARLARKLRNKKGRFATLAGVQESTVNSRKANHILYFGYELNIRTADGRHLRIKDGEEDGETGTRQAPGLLLVRREDFLAIQGYNSELRGWGWEDQDIISRLTLGAGLNRVVEGNAIHISHDDDARISAYPEVSSRWESRDAMFRKALANYDRAYFMGTFDNDRATLLPSTRIVSGARINQKIEAPVPSRTPKRARPTLSVCMIVRDEEAVLNRCLENLRGLYDELCVVDTGSTDQTVEIAKSRKAKIRQLHDCNDGDGKIVDFSSPRNASLKMATSDWVLQIDADEVINEGFENVLKYVRENLHHRIGVTLISEGAQWVSGRLFKRLSAGLYKGRIHEYLECSGSFVIDPYIVLENLPNKKGKENSRDRNIRLCELAIADEPSNGRNHHYLGNEYRMSGRLEDARKSYREALRLKSFPLGLFHTAYYLAICYLLEEDWSGAIEAGFEAVKIDSRYAEAHCLIGDAYTCADKPALAKPWYENALRCKSPPPDAVLPVQLWAYSKHPLERLQKMGAL